MLFRFFFSVLPTLFQRNFRVCVVLVENNWFCYLLIVFSRCHVVLCAALFQLFVDYVSINILYSRLF